MSTDLIRYRHLERQLWLARWRHQGNESAEEDTILDQMERSWLDLAESEQALLRSEGPRCWPTDPTTLPPQFEDARYFAQPEAWVYEGFLSASQAILSVEPA